MDVPPVPSQPKGTNEQSTSVKTNMTAAGPLSPVVVQPSPNIATPTT